MRANSNVLYSCFQGKGELLEQPEDLEDDHDNDNHSNYIKDVSAHAADSYQIAHAMVNITQTYQHQAVFHLQQRAATFPRTRTRG